jgi:ubiquinone/menaquinone biosynthesis C-methylase UbiE
MLAVARSVLSEGAPVNWIEGSALDLPFPSDSRLRRLASTAPTM